jgi:hypothetical protein
MTHEIGHEATIPNPTLERFSALVGQWATEGTHPMVPGTTFHGRTSFEWMLGGAFLLMRSEIHEPEIPSGLAVIGSDDATGAHYMLYFDERGVSRKYDVSFDGDTVKWWRDAPGFSQRFAGRLSSDGRAIVGNGELLRDGEHWEGDLALTYTRAR